MVRGHQITEHSNSGRLLRRRAPRKIKKERRGGKREGAGRPYKKPLAWLRKFSGLKDRAIYERFISYAIEQLWRTNSYDARSAGTIGNMLRLYGEVKGWIVKTPLQIIQAQQVGADPKKAIIDFIANIKNAELRNALVAYAKSEAEKERAVLDQHNSRPEPG